MRHRNKVNSLTRTAPHRKAMLANMATSLILHKRIKTTVAKAKVLRSFFEPIITKAKDDSMHSRRYAFTKLRDKEGVKELFKNVMPVVGERQSGYTRILKIGHRVSDNALMCYMELVDFNTTYKSKEESAKKRRTRRGKTTTTTTKKVENEVQEIEVKNTTETPQEENTDSKE